MPSAANAVRAAAQNIRVETSSRQRIMNHLPHSNGPVCALLALFASAGFAHGQNAASARVQGIRFWSFGDITRVVIQTQGNYRLASDQIENPSRAYFDLAGLRPP